ncbi:MAG: glycosyltransferase 87 family protein [Anaerolineae bacterium]
MSRLRTLIRTHHDFLILLTLFTSFRWLVLVSYRPGGYILDFSDYYFYRSFAQLSHRGLYPFVNVWAAYPPLFPYLMIGLYRLSALIPAWNNTGVWFYTLLGTVLLLFEAGNLILIYCLAHRLGGPAQARRASWFYALLFVPVYTLTGWFEAMPLCFFLLALYALVLGRHRWSAVATGLGFMSKLVPALLVPLALRTLWDRKGRRWREMALYLFLVATVVLLIALPFLFTEPRLLLGPFQTQAHREPWESLWALWDGQYSYGIVRADIRNLENVGGPQMPTRVPWPLVTAGFALAFLFLYTRPTRWTEPRSQVAFAGLCTLGLLLYSKGYSPQFAVWVLPFVALLLPNLRGAAYAILLGALNWVEANVYFIVFPSQHQLLVAVVALRTAIFLLLAGELTLVLFPLLADRLGMWRRWAAVGLVAASFLTALALAPGLARAYFQDRLARNPCREAITYLQQEAEAESLLLFTQQETLDLFYPYLWRHAPCRVLDDYAGAEGLADQIERQLQDLSQEHQDLWLVTQEGAATDRLAPLASEAMDRLFVPVQEETLGTCTLRRYAPR